MEFNLPSQIVKNLSFGDEARNKILSGVYKLSDAVKSTLGASFKVRVAGHISGGNSNSGNDVFRVSWTANSTQQMRQGQVTVSWSGTNQVFVLYQSS
jgi:hypothetical protein